MNTATAKTKTPNTRNVAAALARAGLTADTGIMSIERGNGVEITVCIMREWDDEDRFLTRGAVDAQGRIRRVDSDATDALETRVQDALAAAGFARFGVLSTGWGGWVLQSKYRDSNPHNLDGFADPMHY